MDRHDIPKKMPHPWAEEGTTLFASRVWFDHWLAAFGDTNSGLWSVEQGESDCQIPYRIESRRIGPVTLRVAVGATNSHTPQFDLVGAGNLSAADVHRMMSELRVSVLIFPFVSLQSKLAKALASPTRQFGTFRDDCETAFVIDCTGSWEAYVESRGKSRAAEWRAKERRALRAGDRFQVLSSWDDVARVWEDVLRVEASGWKGRKGTAIRQAPDARSFYAGVCRDLAIGEKLRLFLHWRGDRIIAFHLCTLHAGRLTSLKSGYDEEFAKDSPGQIVRWWMVKWAFENPEVRILDFLGPVTETKRQWATAVEELFTLYAFRRNTAGTLGWLRWSAGPRLKHRWQSALIKKPREPRVLPQESR